MTKNVFAGKWEIAAENGMNKSIARFPDVCMSPPSPPAGPIPIPYPNTSFSNNLKSASTTVLIGGKGAALAQKSYYKESVLGNEAATRTFGANVVSHQITGKTFFQAWCMDVKFENKNVCRHFDITTSNHASVDTTDVPAPAVEVLDMADGDDKSDPTKWCQCCKLHPPHSENQKNGNDISEDDFYNPKETGLRARTVGVDKATKLPKYRMEKGPPPPGEAKQIKTALKRVADMRVGPCKDQLPPDNEHACNKYYRITAKEKEDIDILYNAAADDYNPDKPAHWRGAKMIAHRVPRNAGGCPVGPNAVPVTTDECKKKDHELGKSQGQVDAIYRDKPPPTNGIVLS